MTKLWFLRGFLKLTGFAVPTTERSVKQGQGKEPQGVRGVQRTTEGVERSPQKFEFFLDSGLLEKEANGNRTQNRNRKGTLEIGT